MAGDEQLDLLRLSDSSQLPETLADAIHQLETSVLQQITHQAAEKQLFYHNEEHIRAVQQRSHRIFAVIAPALAPDTDLARTELLLDLCAIAHDLVQQFEHHSQTHTSRQRKSGVNELATIDEIIFSIHQLNQHLTQQSPDHPARLVDADIEVIRQAIAATICAYDDQEQAIYQPLLYSGESLSVVSRVLALADLNTLGMDGIEAYNREGSLLFLEENLDVVPLLQGGGMDQLELTDPDLTENIRQRLLKRCRFQVNFAKSRLIRLPQELQEFPQGVIPVLMTETFKYLTPATLQTLKASTPMNSDTPLTVLLEFFQFEKYLTPYGGF